MKERSSSVPGQGLTKEARNIIDDVPCHDDVCLVEPLQYRTASYKNYKISLWNPQALSDPGRPAFSASTRHCWVKSFKVWWHFEVQILKA